MTEKNRIKIGQSCLPFEDWFALNNLSGMEYFVVEHDNPSQPYRDAISRSHDAVRAMRF